MTCTNTFDPTTYDKPDKIELIVEDEDAKDALEKPLDGLHSLYMFARE